jgi:hypothetical protein
MKYFILFVSLFTLATARANAGLVIHAAEIGIGKFHRYDNSVHPYEKNNAWTPYILPSDANDKTPLVVENDDRSFTIFFSTLEELLKKSAEISLARGEKISVLNINAHGLPGSMWFPMNESFKNSFECWQWNAAATGQDKANYDQYYSPISKNDILSIRQYSESGGAVQCTSGLRQWKLVLNQVAQAKASFSSNLKVNLLSCVVGLGPVGDQFMTGLGALLSDSDQAQFLSSLNFGLGDWSMAEGMGFWDYLTDEQLSHDNSIYGVNRKDREIMQKGKIRVTALVKGSWQSSVVEGQDFMTLARDLDLSQAKWGRESFSRGAKKPQQVRVPGTSIYEFVK